LIDDAISSDVAAASYLWGGWLGEEEEGVVCTFDVSESEKGGEREREKERAISTDALLEVSQDLGAVVVQIRIATRLGGVAQLSVAVRPKRLLEVHWVIRCLKEEIHVGVAEAEPA
tara:strand:+ start:824 stop:1171 length:348 start_codon:yes stop_codon:yes gene_type:complete